MRLIQLIIGTVTFSILTSVSALAAVPEAKSEAKLSVEPSTAASISTAGLLKTDFAMKAKVSHAKAQRLALDVQPGSVVAAALKSHEGVLVWRVKVLCPDNNLHELMIDAADGHVRSDLQLVSR